jgi:hypothetical protein
LSAEALQVLQTLLDVKLLIQEIHALHHAMTAIHQMSRLMKTQRMTEVVLLIPNFHF